MCWLPSAHSRQVFLKRFEFKMAYVLSQMFGVWNGTGVTNFLLRKRRIDTLQARLSPVRFFPSVTSYAQCLKITQNVAFEFMSNQM